jgi:hypothetical protein
MSRPIIETEETLIIETPERVPLAFALASIGNRFLAVAIDHVIQYFSIFVVAWFFMLASGLGETIEAGGGAYAVLQEMPKWTIALMIVLLFLIFAGYFVFFEWLWNGRCPAGLFNRSNDDFRQPPRPARRRSVCRHGRRPRAFGRGAEVRGSFLDQSH